MARDFGPFPSRPMYEVVNRRMQRLLAEATSSTGFARAGQGAVTAGTGAELVIAAYPDGALVDGLYVENPDAEPVTLTTNSASTNPRIDRLVMRLDMGAETIAPFQIVGTPGASPSAPPLVKTATVVDMPLCRYTFPGSASAQNPGSIVDERTFVGAPGGVIGLLQGAATVANQFSAGGSAAEQRATPSGTLLLAAGRYYAAEWQANMIRNEGSGPNLQIVPGTALPANSSSGLRIGTAAGNPLAPVIFRALTSGPYSFAAFAQATSSTTNDYRVQWSGLLRLTDLGAAPLVSPAALATSI